jgi:hypothetical protein
MARLVGPTDGGSLVEALSFPLTTILWPPVGAAGSLVRAPLVFDPSGVVTAGRIKMCPVKHATFRIPLILTPELNPVSLE